MLTKRIIPCLDIKNGRAVKGINFMELRDAGDPVELAEIYANEGVAQFIFLKGNEKPEVTYADRDGKYMGQTGVTLPKVPYWFAGKPAGWLPSAKSERLMPSFILAIRTEIEPSANPALLNIKE